MIINKELPQDINAEKVILGYFISNQDTSEKLKPKYFYSENHQKIYECLLDGKFLITQDLAEEKKFDFFKYMDCVESYAAGNIDHLIDRVLDCYYRRKRIVNITREEIELYDMNKPISSEALSISHMKDEVLSGSAPDRDWETI